MATSQDNVRFIHRFRQALGKAQVMARSQQHREKAQQEKLRAALELWFDDLKQEGIDPRSALGVELTAQRFFSEPEAPEGEVW